MFFSGRFPCRFAAAGRYAAQLAVARPRLRRVWLLTQPLLRIATAFPSLGDA
jgi:hypothetical protein